MNRAWQFAGGLLFILFCARPITAASGPNSPPYGNRAVRVASAEVVPKPVPAAPSNGTLRPEPQVDASVVPGVPPGHDPSNPYCSCEACAGFHDPDVGADCDYACRRPSLAGWVDGEYLMWWLAPMQVPPLVTRGTVASEGRIGPDTDVLVGGELLERMRSGARLRFGLWTDPCRGVAWDAEGLIVGRTSERLSFSGNGAAGTPVISRPYFDVATSTAFPNGGEDAELVAFPGQLSGTVTVQASSELYGVAVHRTTRLYERSACEPALFGCRSVPQDAQLLGFIGWRHLNLQEGLVINEDLTSLRAAPDDGRFLIEDRFETNNSFHGADLGFLWKEQRGRLSLDLLMRLGLGSTRQRVLINGSTTVRGSTEPTNNFENATGGLLAQRTNIGDYSRSRLAVVPELGATLGYALSPQWRATVGYSFLYWSSVVRPGDQIDREVNSNLLPPEENPLTGVLRPRFTFVESDLWINGLNFGLERTW